MANSHRTTADDAMIPKRLMQLVLQILLLTASAAMWSPANAGPAGDSASTAPVFVAHQCDDDPIGTRISFKLKEAIRRSTRFSTATNYEDSVVQVTLLCIPPYEDDRGVVSSFSFVITLTNQNWKFDTHLASGVRRCGSSRVDSCAEGMLAALDEVFDDVLASLKEHDQE